MPIDLMPVAPASSGSGGLTQTAVKTANYTAASGDLVLFDIATAAANLELKLPASPSVGNRVGAVIRNDDAGAVGVAGNHMLHIHTNSEKLMAAAAIAGVASCYSLMYEGDYVEFEYIGSDTGWFVRSDGIQRHAGSMYSTVTTSLTTGANTVVQMNTALHDTGGIVSLSDDRFIIRRPGLYQFSWMGIVPNLDAAEAAAGNVSIDGGYPAAAASSGYVVSTIANMGYTIVQSTATLLLNAGSYAQFTVYHQEGASQNIRVGDNNEYPYLTMEELVPGGGIGLGIT